MLSFVKTSIRRMLANAIAPMQMMAERSLILQAQLATQAVRTRERLDSLDAAEFRAFSQWGEDGIIDWLVEHLPGIPRSFVEFGVQDYRESNTRLLLQLRNWRGLVMDGSLDHIADIRSQDVSWRHDLTAQCAFIDRDNINGLIVDAGFSGPIGLLSIDLDGNDYWVWEAINAVFPAIVVCEYNAVFGDRFALTIPYRADFQRSAAHRSNLYFGASIKALAVLAERKGYTFVGSTSTGCNAFFVRNDLMPALRSKIIKIGAYPSAVREARDKQGQLTFSSGTARKAIIERMPLIDIEAGVETTLATCGKIYSPEWAAGQCAQWV